MNEAERSEKRAQRVEQAKRFIANLQNEIEVLKLKIATMPKFHENSNLPNPNKRMAEQELRHLEQKLKDNSNAVAEATVEDNDVKNILNNIDI